MFAQLSEAEFGELKVLLQFKTYPKIAIVAEIGKQNNDLYLIRKGRVALRTVDKRGRDPVVGTAGPGAILNELAFATGRPADATIETLEETTFWYIPYDKFSALLADHDTIGEHIVYSEAAKEYVFQSKKFDEQRPGEKVLWFARKHWLVLFNSLWLTYLLGLAMAALLIPSVAAGLQGLALPVALPVALALGLIALGNLAWQLIDYFNDYYVVTDQRVIHRERVILIYDQQDEAPMGKVQNVSIARPGGIYALFDIGQVNVETQGASANIEFAYAPQPEVPNKLILARRDEARIQSRAPERSRVRVELLRQMQLAPFPEDGGKKKEEKKTPLNERLAKAWTDFRNEVIPRMRLVRGGEIIYRKHWLNLLGTAAAPALSFLIYVAILVLIARTLPDLANVIFGLPFVLALIVIGFVLAFWFVWQYENWRNDLYILSNDKLVDYKRTPFGLQGENKKTAGLDNVQNVTATTRGFIDMVFNIGDVSVKTGGADNELNFARVWNPRNVQREIAKALEEFQNNKQVQEAKRRREEFIEWMGIYDELTRLHDRNRIK